MAAKFRVETWRFFSLGFLFYIYYLIRKLLLFVHPWGHFNYTLFLKMSIFNFWLLISELYELSLEVISFIPLHAEGLLPLLQRGSRFNRSYALLVLLVPDPQEIKEHVALRWPLCMSTHQNHSRQVARVEDDKKTIPSFISQLLSHTRPFNLKTDQKNPMRNGLKGSAPRWQRITKSNCYLERKGA